MNGLGVFALAFLMAIVSQTHGQGFNVLGGLGEQSMAGPGEQALVQKVRVLFFLQLWLRSCLNYINLNFSKSTLYIYRTANFHFVARELNAFKWLSNKKQFWKFNILWFTWNAYISKITLQTELKVIIFKVSKQIDSFKNSWIHEICKMVISSLVFKINIDIINLSS